MLDAPGPQCNRVPPILVFSYVGPLDLLRHQGLGSTPFNAPHIATLVNSWELKNPRWSGDPSCNWCGLSSCHLWSDFMNAYSSSNLQTWSNKKKDQDRQILLTYQFSLAPLAESTHYNSDTQAEGEDTGDYNYLTGWSSWGRQREIMND